MVNRPAGGARSKRYEREPYDWYCEPAWSVRALFERIDFGDDLIWDPACGRGNVLDMAKERGHLTFGSDVVDRHAKHTFKRGDFLTMERPPSTKGRALSIVTNPPYSYKPDIAEAFIRKAMTLPIRRAAFLVPIAFLCSDTRWRLFERDFKPSHVAVLSQRPSMPPGSTVTDATEFKGGMADYVWIVWTAPHRWKTQTIWLQPYD
jgi:hypothetical protein